MNYRHAFHAGNHADVLKHIVLLALCDALTAKPTPCYALDTHAGRGLYALDGNSAQRTRESQDGIGRLLAEAPRHPLVTRYLAAIKACRSANGPHAYPGSPWLLAHALRADDRITCCELQPEEAEREREGAKEASALGNHCRITWDEERRNRRGAEEDGDADRAQGDERDHRAEMRDVRRALDLAGADVLSDQGGRGHRQPQRRDQHEEKDVGADAERGDRHCSVRGDEKRHRGHAEAA